MSDVPQLRLERLVVDISVRLQRACAHLTDSEFRELVLDIAHMKIRFDAIDDATYGRDSADRTRQPPTDP